MQNIPERNPAQDPVGFLQDFAWDLTGYNSETNQELGNNAYNGQTEGMCTLVAMSHLCYLSLL